jgi:hypothetical protein
MDKPKCETCAYRTDTGICRRFPTPRAVKDDDWCGEHPDFVFYLTAFKERFSLEKKADD